MCAALRVGAGSVGAENEEDTWSGFGASLRRPEGRPYLHLYTAPTLSAPELCAPNCAPELGGGNTKIGG